MASVRAEVLAASRPRTGLKSDADSFNQMKFDNSIHKSNDSNMTIDYDHKPVIGTLKQAFENKLANQTQQTLFNRSNSIPTSGANTPLNGRKLGTKVSQIATIFQSMSPKSLDESLSNSSPSLSITKNRVSMQKSNSLCSMNDEETPNYARVNHQSELSKNALAPSNNNYNRFKDKSRDEPNTVKCQAPIKVASLPRSPVVSQPKTNGVKSSLSPSPIQKVHDQNNNNGKVVSPIQKTELISNAKSNVNKTVPLTSLLRSESRVSRFNTARAIFEKLQAPDRPSSKANSNCSSLENVSSNGVKCFNDSAFEIHTPDHNAHITSLDSNSFLDSSNHHNEINPSFEDLSESSKTEELFDIENIPNGASFDKCIPNIVNQEDDHFPICNRTLPIPEHDFNLSDASKTNVNTSSSFCDLGIPKTEEHEPLVPLTDRLVTIDNVPHFVRPDGEMYYEAPPIGSDNCEETPSVFYNPEINELYVSNQKCAKVHFSEEPVKVFFTFSAEEFDRRNEDFDPIIASAEFELERRVENMHVFPVDIIKGNDGLGISIIG